MRDLHVITFFFLKASDALMYEDLMGGHPLRRSGTGPFKSPPTGIYLPFFFHLHPSTFSGSTCMHLSKYRSWVLENLFSCHKRICFEDHCYVFLNFVFTMLVQIQAVCVFIKVRVSCDTITRPIIYVFMMYLTF